MERKINKIIGLICLLLIAFYLIWSIYGSYQLHNDFSFTTAKINHIALPGWKSSGDYSVLYEYEVNGEKYKGNANYNLCPNQTRDDISVAIVNKRFPVAYSKKQIGTSAIILTESRARDFNYKIPDSLLVYDSLLTCK